MKMNYDVGGPPLLDSLLVMLSHPSFRRLLHAAPRPACNLDIVIIVQHVAVAKGSSRYLPSRFMDDSSHYPRHAPSAATAAKRVY